MYIYPEGSIFSFDNERHYYKITNQCDQIEWSACENYPPMYSWLAQFFVDGEFSFLLFNLFFVMIAFPLAISFITKSWDFGLLFLLYSNIGLLTLNVGTYPTLLALLIWTAFYLNKNPIIRIALFTIGLFTHNGLYLVLIATWLLEYLVKIDWKQHLPVAFTSPFEFNFNLTKILTGLPKYLDFCFKSGFIVSYLIGLKQLIIEKKYELIILVFASFILSFSIIRAFYLAVFILIWGFTRFYEQQEDSIKHRILIGGIIYKSFMIWFIFYL